MTPPRRRPGRAISKVALAFLLSASPALGDEVDEALAGGDTRAAEATTETTSKRGAVIEEVIVTAQKSERSLRDVPISMSVIDDDMIQREGIADFREIARYAPNVTIDDSSTFPDIRIRGFGSPLSNKAFEQPVALVIDGIPYGRTPYWQGPLFDLERVEVLRGPQGTLFGKNTTAGLFNVVTAKPTRELSGFVDLQLGELDRRRFEAAVGGAILPDLLHVRLSGLLDERDGIVRNTTAAVLADTNDRMNARDRKVVRFQIDAPDVAGARIVLGYEHADLELVGTGWEFRRVAPSELDFYREWDPGTDTDPENWVGSIDRGEIGTRKIDTVVVNASYPLGEWQLDGIAGYSMLSLFNANDVDFTPAPMFFTDSEDENPQTTGELRVSSPTLAGLLGLSSLFGVPLGQSDVTAGVFVQRRELNDSRLSIGLNVPVVAQFVIAQGIPLSLALSELEGTNALPFGIALPLDEESIGFLLDAGVGVEESTGLFEQSTDSIAGFTHVNWDFADAWSLQYGMRFTWEQKEADVARVFTKGTGIAFNVLAGQEEFEASRKRSETAFTPKVALKYDWTDDVNTFASWAQGFKAGGFNELASVGTQGLEFETERATAWELGSKMRLLDGAAALSIALFWQDVTDLQVFTLRPENLIATVENAGEARARGVEVDASWLPADWLSLAGSVGFNDAKFLEFPFGTCPMDADNTDGDDDPRCDLSGEPLFRTPKWVSTVTGTGRWPLTGLSGALPSPVGEAELVLGTTVEYQDVQFTQRTMDPRSRQDAFFRVRALAGLEHPEQGWAVRVTAENLTDEAIAIQSRDVTLGQGTFSHILEEPRLLFATVRWAF